MTDIVFHILSDAGDDARLRRACQLADEYREQQQRVFMLVDSDTNARRLDDLLWTFRDQAFIPHEVIAAGSSVHAGVGVLIGTEAMPAEVLINLTDSAPASLGDYAQVAEVVDADEARKKLARDRYRQYREQGFALNTITA